MINFKLQNIDRIEDMGINWFVLTDGDLWLTLGDNTLFEYTTDTLAFWDQKTTKYNDYYLARFVEDFSALFKIIAESVPEKFYTLSENIVEFEKGAEKWLENNDSEEDADDYEFYSNEYYPLIMLFGNRFLDSGHLTGAPKIYFVRYKDKMRITWESDEMLENGQKIWTASSGMYEMEFSEFVKKSEEFGLALFNSMSEQVKKAIDKDWGDIELDRDDLLKDHSRRRADYFKQLDYLKNGTDHKTDWNQLDTLYEKMRLEIQSND